MASVLDTSALVSSIEPVAAFPAVDFGLCPAGEQAVPTPLAASEPTGRYDGAIRACDIAFALALLILCLPLILLIAAAIAPSGPVLFAQRRIGRGGKEFRCLKFRTMVTDAEERLRRVLESDPAARDDWEQYHKLKDDPRTTAFGRFLRRSSFDELPQLINILVGSMSVVGPRPIVRAEIPRYGRYFEEYCTVRPGLTGLWQVSGRNDVSYRRRVALDVSYVRRRCLSLYIVIILKTPLMMFGNGGAY